MLNIDKIKHHIVGATHPISLSNLLELEPHISRRTIQRNLKELIEIRAFTATGQGRSKAYNSNSALLLPKKTEVNFPSYIPLSADSKDILAYLEQPVEVRKPVGYQREFLDEYQPNITRYLSKPLCQQLARMGNTGKSTQPAGTYGRDILSRLLIDLSWASSNLEGNTYSRLDTVELIEHGNAAF